MSGAGGTWARVCARSGEPEPQRTPHFARRAHLFISKQCADAVLLAGGTQRPDVRIILKHAVLGVHAQTQLAVSLKFDACETVLPPSLHFVKVKFHGDVGETDVALSATNRTEDRGMKSCGAWALCEQ